MWNKGFSFGFSYTYFCPHLASQDLMHFVPHTNEYISATKLGSVDKFAQNHTLSQPLSYTPKQVQYQNDHLCLESAMWPTKHPSTCWTNKWSGIEDFFNTIWKSWNQVQTSCTILSSYKSSKPIYIVYNIEPNFFCLSFPSSFHVNFIKNLVSIYVFNLPLYFMLQLEKWKH